MGLGCSPPSGTGLLWGAFVPRFPCTFGAAVTWGWRSRRRLSRCGPFGAPWRPIVSRGGLAHRCRAPCQTWLKGYLTANGAKQEGGRRKYEGGRMKYEGGRRENGEGRRRYGTPWTGAEQEGFSASPIRRSSPQGSLLCSSFILHTSFFIFFHPSSFILHPSTL